MSLPRWINHFRHRLEGTSHFQWFTMHNVIWADCSIRHRIIDLFMILSLHPHLCGCQGRRCMVGPCDPVSIYRHVLGSMTHWNFSLMPLVPSAVEHSSVGPGSGARDYTVPAFHYVAVACTTGVWEHLIRFHCDTQTMVHTWLGQNFGQTIFLECSRNHLFGVHCYIILYHDRYSTFKLVYSTFINFLVSYLKIDVLCWLI